MLDALEQADRDAFEELHHIHAGILDTLPDANLQWSHAFRTALQAILAGDLERAEELATAALNFGLETGQEDVLIIYGAQLLNIRMRQGRLGELLSLVEDAVKNRPRLGVYRAVLAVAHAETGDLGRCRQLLDAEHSAGFVIPEDSNWTTAHAYWAEAAVRSGHTDAALVLLGRITPFAHHLVTTLVSASPVVTHSIGRLQHLLGRLDEADASYGRALRLHEGLRCPIFVCTTQAAWATLLADRDRGDDLVRARALAEQARQTASDGGYGNVARDAARLLERLS
jgi:tetratricopeptide (TPR) repeat protein